MTEAEFLAERARRMTVPILSNPDRRHEPQGIGDYCPPPDRTEVPVSRLEAFNAALEFVSDVCSPEGYGHAAPPEMIRRAARILAMLRPKEPQCGVGYMEPPPARCQKCDEE